ncbi:response regulator transcription factor [Catenulispora subtropica]|uniref:Response regulator transcription factor n=1 Tax=Catenulispora subtropica TaxID=450798 RepID=A0ABP5BPC1_9ACTN
MRRPPGPQPILWRVRVLIVEDDGDMRYAAAAALRASGLAVDAVGDLPEADETLFVNSYACVIFDRNLPSGDAADYVRERRARGWAPPVLFLTARDSVQDRVAGFASGGDDYLVKPFATEEFVARVRSICRRAGQVRPPVLRVGTVEVDSARREVRHRGLVLTLTPKEFAVLEQLALRDGAAVSRADLVESCWDEMAEPASNVVDVVMAQLRRKLGEPAPIETVRGVGYRLRDSDLA